MRSPFQKLYEHPTYIHLMFSALEQIKHTDIYNTYLLSCRKKVPFWDWPNYCPKLWKAAHQSDMDKFKVLRLNIPKCSSTFEGRHIYSVFLCKYLSKTYGSSISISDFQGYDLTKTVFQLSYVIWMQSFAIQTTIWHGQMKMVNICSRPWTGHWNLCQVLHTIRMQMVMSRLQFFMIDHILRNQGLLTRFIKNLYCSTSGVISTVD